MDRLRLIFVLLSTAFALLACGPAPEEVCDHFSQVMVGNPKKEASKPMFDAMKQAGREGCAQGLAKLKEKDSSMYKQVASCIMAANDIPSLGQCGGMGK